MTQSQHLEPEVYQGQFGEFTITTSDRTGVIIYRASLIIAAFSFAIGTILVFWDGDNQTILSLLTPLYASFWLSIGVSLLTIHIYLAILHRLLQVFWIIGGIAAIALVGVSSDPLILEVYQHPMTLFGIGFTFVALTGIYFKEAFCFNHLETKILTPLVPILLLGHLTGFLSAEMEQILLALWAILFLVFALRKVFMAIPLDIGDKSVFAYLQTKGSLSV